MNAAGMAVLLQRGNCSFSQKAGHLQQAKAAVGLVANFDEGTACNPGADLSFFSRHTSGATVQIACSCPLMVLSLTLTTS